MIVGAINIRTIRVSALGMEGKFIVIDGPDYCGKGTQCRLLVPYLMDHPSDKTAKRITVLATREPSNSDYGMHIRDMLAAEADPKENAAKFANLFIEDRKMHLQNQVLPALENGAVVVSDRYMYSTIAYQAAQGIDPQTLIQRQTLFCVPDLSIIIPSLETIIKRKAAAKERSYEEVFEKQHAFMAAVRDNYVLMKDWLPGHNLIYVDGNRSIENVFGDIKHFVDKVVFPGR